MQPGRLCVEFRIAWQYSFIRQILLFYLPLCSISNDWGSQPEMARRTCRTIHVAIPFCGTQEQTVHEFTGSFTRSHALWRVLALSSKDVHPLNFRGFIVLACLACAYVILRIKAKHLGSLYILPHMLLFPIMLLTLRAARCENYKQMADPETGWA